MFYFYRVVLVLVQYLHYLRGICFPLLEKLGFYGAFGLLHDILVAELQLYLVEALHIGVSDLTVLVTVTFLNLFRPFDTIELKEKVQNVNSVCHIDESKPNSALGLQVFRQIKVVVMVLKPHVDQSHHVCLSELDRDISDHQSRLPEDLQVTVSVRVNDSIEVDLVVLWPDKDFLFGCLDFVVLVGGFWRFQIVLLG